MQATQLVNQLAAQIAEEISSGRLAAGERLIERRLAERLRVSRSPVRAALRVLQEAGAVVSGESGGLFVADASALPSLPVPFVETDEDEAAYTQIAEDRVEGRLPNRMTEAEFMRRYGLTKARLGRILRRMANEGWAERLPGHGWEFRPVLTSLQSYQDSYRFRLLIEPAALLEPSFKIDREALTKRREEQLWLVGGAVFEVTDATLFELNSGMHQTLIECSCNEFFIDALKRLDRLRRLIDYRQMLPRKSTIERCREHVHLLELVLAGQRVEASAFLRRHLADLSDLKTRVRSDRQNRVERNFDTAAE